ncbi:MAG: 1-acyl-sn-glycerol-3-phosphate acyltransferase [Flavobacteriales bacterium]
MSKREKPFHVPPVHRRHMGYQLALPWVWSGITRFHRSSVISGLDNMPEPKVPTIIVCNHQNGLMDPIIHSSFLPHHHIHWLTRSDIFYKKIIRMLLFSFNMLPVFRQRDRLSDIRERNQKIFEVCVERLALGAVVGLFPEGNHHGARGLRPLKRGVVDMVTMAVNFNDSMMDRLQVIPVGLDYEQYDGFQRRLSYRMGAPIRFQKHLKRAQNGHWEMDLAPFLDEVSDALRQLMVDIPSGEVASTDWVPYVGALRTTELKGPDFDATRDQIQNLRHHPDPQSVVAAAQALRDSHLLKRLRPEDIGRHAGEVRKSRIWPWLLTPIMLPLGWTLWPVMVFLKKQADRRIKDICFKSTFKTTSGMALFPIIWLLCSTLVALIVGLDSDGWSWTAFGASYGFNLIGTRIAGSWYGWMRDEWGAQAAQKFWNRGGADVSVWSEYVKTIEKK